MIKKIELEVEFADGFVPPERFDAPTQAKNYKSECEKCPFYGWDDEYANGWCVLSGEEACQIKKYFL